jgi:NAD(P)-dependent dehydrogenase (short-subunit alcohol dehydrogenase family)
LCFNGAVSQITLSAALDLAGTGVRVNEVRPGETNTAMLASERGYTLSQAEIDVKLKSIAESIPEKRLADHSEISAAAIFYFLMSPVICRVPVLQLMVVTRYVK